MSLIQKAALVVVAHTSRALCREDSGRGFPVGRALTVCVNGCAVGSIFVVVLLLGVSIAGAVVVFFFVVCVFLGDGSRSGFVVCMSTGMGKDMSMTVKTVLNETLSPPTGAAADMAVTVDVFVVAA